MTTEVELKYLVINENVSQTIFELLTKQQLTFTHRLKKLCNCYFDTKSLVLRQLDMGLRIRIDEQHIEQTIKTAGIVVGGLHQRPEYNIDISTPFPDLSLFPETIWPADVDIGDLQQQLTSLFTTDFTREIWLINYRSSVIELAFDQGKISADGRELPICEIELELSEGHRDDLFALAQLLFQSLLVRAGTQSKAARGYRLAANQMTEPSQSALDIYQQTTQAKAYFVAGIQHCLQQLQAAVDAYLDSEQLTDLAHLTEVLSLMRHGFWLFEEKLNEASQQIRSELSYFIQLFAWVDNAIYLQELMNKTGNYRKKLDYSEQLIEQLRLEEKYFPDASMVRELLHSERFNLLQISLLTLVVDGNTSAFFLDNAEDDELTHFAQVKLSQSLNLLCTAMSSVNDGDAEQYLAQRKSLHRGLLTGHWFGSLFEQNQRDQFRTPWVDIKQGLRELQSLWLIKQQLDKLEAVGEQSNEKIVTWQHSKVENLLVALDQSKAAALSNPAYWLI